MKALTIGAAIEHIATATAFVEDLLEAFNCPEKVRKQMDIAIDEILSNIVKYAHLPPTGTITIEAEVTQSPRKVKVTFIDSGVPYDLTASNDPDVTLSASEREIGGLGGYIVKKSMDDVSYEYKDGKNMLCITKLFESKGGHL